MTMIFVGRHDAGVEDVAPTALRTRSAGFPALAGWARFWRAAGAGAERIGEQGAESEEGFITRDTMENISSLRSPDAVVAPFLFLGRRGKKCKSEKLKSERVRIPHVQSTLRFMTRARSLEKAAETRVCAVRSQEPYPLQKTQRVGHPQVSTGKDPRERPHPWKG
jgi:hypothetical protein